MNRCRKLLDLPLVSSEWQQTTWCPDCEYYAEGECTNPASSSAAGSCPLDDPAWAVREVKVDSHIDRAEKVPAPGYPVDPEERVKAPRLEQAIRQQVVRRTGGRIRSLEVALHGGELTIRGNVPCYHVKQLALQGVLTVLDLEGARDIKITLAVEVAAAPLGTQDR